MRLLTCARHSAPRVCTSVLFISEAFPQRVLSLLATEILSGCDWVILHLYKHELGLVILKLCAGIISLLMQLYTSPQVPAV